MLWPGIIFNTGSSGGGGETPPELDGVTPGIAEAEKAIVTDESNEVTSLATLGVDTLNVGRNGADGQAGAINLQDGENPGETVNVDYSLIASLVTAAETPPSSVAGANGTDPGDPGDYVIAAAGNGVNGPVDGPGGDGGSFYVDGGAGGAATAADQDGGDGGDVHLRGGYGADGGGTSGTSGRGGDVYITPGQAGGSGDSLGRVGLIILYGSLPTSDPGVSGALYTTAGALMVSAG